MKIDDLSVGMSLGPSEWWPVDQARIDSFAAATDDRQWIHVDPERAAAGPFGATVAHGFLTLSLLAPFSYELLPLEGGMVVNYGLERVRFPNPVPSGARIRARIEIDELSEVADGTQVTVTWTVEVEGAEKPACVATQLFRVYDWGVPLPARGCAASNFDT